MSQQLITYKDELLHKQADNAKGRGEDTTEELNVIDEDDSLYDDTPRSKIDLEESLLNNTKLESSQQSGNRSERSTLQKCPCGLSDRTSSYIKCENCKQFSFATNTAISKVELHVPLRSWTTGNAHNVTSALMQSVDSKVSVPDMA